MLSAFYLVGISSYFIYSFLRSIVGRHKHGLLQIDFKHFLMVTFYILGPSLSDYLISYMMCETVDGGLYLKKDPEYSCLVSSYYFWLVFFYIPSNFIIWTAPIFIYYKFYTQKQKKIHIKFDSQSFYASNFYEIGYSKKNVIFQEVYISIQKLLLIVLNQSSIQANIKYPSLLLIMLITLIALDPLILNSRQRIFYLLDVCSKSSIISIVYLLQWVSDDDYENSVVEEGKINHLVIFFIMGFFQLLNLLLHSSIVFRSFLVKIRTYIKGNLKIKFRSRKQKSVQKMDK